MNFARIDCSQARQLLSESTETRPVQVVDIRDDASFEAGHLPDAVHLHNSNIQDFIQAADLDAPLLVYCYHGNMSQSAAAYLAEQGFTEAYSLDGGFEAWASSE